VNERALTTPAERKAVHCDPLHNAQIRILRELLTATDLAMEIEGVSRESRDRVIHTIVFGEPPAPNPWPDPEAALKRISDHEAFKREVMKAPVGINIADLLG
jgi:hypothetical protein